MSALYRHVNMWKFINARMLSLSRLNDLIENADNKDDKISVFCVNCAVRARCAMTTFCAWEWNILIWCIFNKAPQLKYSWLNATFRISTWCSEDTHTNTYACINILNCAQWMEPAPGIAHSEGEKDRDQNDVIFMFAWASFWHPL